MKRKVKTLTPSYYDKFTCISNKCEDTCCKGWNVNIDKDTYKRYRKSSNSELKDLFRTHIRRERSSEDLFQYAKIRLKEDDRCPFLDDKNLCNVYSCLGEKYMSVTCKEYPRIRNFVYGGLEQSLKTSCPEVARICLLNPKILEFDYSESQIDDNVRISYMINEDINRYDNIHEYFWPIRIFTIGLLQNRKLSIDKRLIVLGMVYKKIHQAISMECYNDIQTIIDQYNDMIEKDIESLKENMNNISEKVDIQIAIAKELMIGDIVEVKHKIYNKILEDTLHGLGINEEMDLDRASELYKEGSKKYYEDYIETKEYILENFLVNEFFSDCMPFSRYDDIWSSYLYICVLYSIIKIHIIGVSLFRKQINDDLIIEVIESFSRVSLHNNQYAGIIVDFLKANKLDTLAYMSILVKN